MPISVTSIVIYPVKSCRGIELQEATVNQYGFELDRFWILADPSTHKQITQREYPRMVLIAPRLEFENQGVDAQGLYAGGGRMIVSAPDMPELVIPFRSRVNEGLNVSQLCRSLEGMNSAKLHVWGNLVDALDEGDEAAAWFTRYLGIPARLLIKDPTSVRTLDPVHTPPRTLFHHEPQTAFADGFPFLLLSAESVNDFNRRLTSTSPATASARNFRPNIIVSGCDAYAEDTWLRLNIAGYPFYVASRCTRCQMPGNDPDTGILGKDPVKALMSYRRVDPGAKYKACFGVNLIQGSTGFFLRVGDEVEVLETGEHDQRGGVWNTEPEEVPVTFVRNEDGVSGTQKNGPLVTAPSETLWYSVGFAAMVGWLGLKL
ncbi:hypothetical protein HK104_006716, partial [Borealophlyctis nickersoniae]